MTPTKRDSYPVLLLARLTAVVLVTLLVFETGAHPAHAGGLAESAVLVVNADSWASTRIANEYLRLRAIPASHVIYLSGLTDFEQLGVEEFRQQILQPVLTAVEARGLTSQIQYVLYSADFPTAINVSADVGGRQLPQVLTRLASLNSLTYLYQLVLAKDARYLDLNCNRYARRLVRQSFDTPWTPEQTSKFAEAAKKLDELTRRRRQPEPKPASKPEPKPDPAAAEQVQAQLQAAIQALQELKQAHPRAPELLYNLACGLAVTNRADEALATLQEAVKAGWWDQRHTRRDEDLATLRERADFKDLLAGMKDQPVSIEPSQGFQPALAAMASSPAGAAPAPSGPDRYLLSTLLACTSGRGNSVAEALAYLRRSAAADHTSPQGTIYFLQNGDIRSTTREWAFRPAIELLKQAGVQAELEPGVLPQKKSAVAGAMIGIADFDWPSSGSTILPGAICEHLTSFGGEMQETAGQTPLSAFLRFGAAAASGTVTEPYAIQAKFPNAFLHLHYVRGCSLAEAFYQSLTGPYQLLIVGDALCRPWAPKLELTAEGWPPAAPLRGTVKVAPRTKAELVATAPFEFYLDGRRLAQIPLGQAYDFDTTKIPDGWHEVVLVGHHNGTLDHLSQLRVSIQIGNSPASLQVTGPATVDVPWDRPLELQASLAGAQEIVWRHNSRQLARSAGAEGRVSLDPRVLGQGPVRLQPVAVLAGEPVREVCGRPLELNIVPPAALAAVEPPAEGERKPGFLVAASGQKPTVVERLDTAALTSAGVAKGSTFTVEAWFRAADDDVYQFQIRSPGNQLKLAVDGRPQDWPQGQPWRFVPVPLAKGFHQLRLEGQVAERPELDIRFGGTGTQRLDAKRQPIWFCRQITASGTAAK